MAGEKQQRLTAAGSAEDLSEYTDADESISAPTEFLAERVVNRNKADSHADAHLILSTLTFAPFISPGSQQLLRIADAVGSKKPQTPPSTEYKFNSSLKTDINELKKKYKLVSGNLVFSAIKPELPTVYFLSAVMLQDYETALKYCKLILQYEPNNATAKEFYPLIVEKLQMIEQDSDSSSSNDNDNGDEQSDSDATTASYSSLEDDGAEEENFALRLSRRFPSLDIANGNASDEDYPQRWISVAQQRLEDAIKQKIDKNRRLLANKIRDRTSDWQAMSPDIEKSTDFVSYTEAERSPGSEDWVQFNSDSESPSDPYSQLTFQEAARR